MLTRNKLNNIESKTFEGLINKRFKLVMKIL